MTNEVERREAHNCVSALLESEERILLVDSFWMLTSAEIIRNSLFVAVCAAALAIAAVWLLAKFSAGPLSEAIVGQITFCTAIICLIYPYLSVVRNIKWIVAVTNLRIIVTNLPSNTAKSGAFVWSLAPKDITSVEKVAEGGINRIRLKLLLSPNRQFMAHVRHINLHGLDEVEQMASKLQSLQIPFHHQGLTKR